ncbi:TonB family protein [Chitinophaga sp.]|uniref:TonB family protein n=1 Tax=Chitinophaga sp. TaxID=1869181 RepID=UPI0031D7A4D6
MQQQNNHIKPLADPELIRRYLAGELDSKAMHALERQALDDPFLAEALDGFEMHAPDQRINLADLSKRLAQRVQPAPKRVIPMYLRWAAAAAVCLAIGSSVIWLWPARNQSEIAKVTVKTDTIIPGEVAGLVQVPETMTTFRKQQNNADTKSYRAPVVPPPALAPAPQPQAEVAAAEPAPAATFDVGKASRLAADDNKDTADVIASQNLYKNNNFNPSDVSVTSLYSKRVTSPSGFDPYMIKGRILNTKGDSGIAGVTVSMGAVGTITDNEGYFSLPNDNMGVIPRMKKMSSNRNEYKQVTAYASGYQSSSTTFKGDPFIRMQLRRTTDTSTTALSSNNEPVPVGGFEKFEIYLAKNVQYPAGLTVSGKVRVQFHVAPDGSLTDFRVLKKLQPECDQEAIRLIKAGPAWMPAANGKAVKVKVDVRFTPEAHQ